MKWCSTWNCNLVCISCVCVYIRRSSCHELTDCDVDLCICVKCIDNGGIFIQFCRNEIR